MAESSSAKYTLDKVSSEVLNEISVELESGRTAALEQVESTLRETESEMAKIIQGGERQADSLKRQTIGSAELDARNKLLRTVEEATNQVFQDAFKKISAGNSAQYEKALARLITDGLSVIGKGAIVACNANDKKTAASIIGELNRKEHADLKLDPKSIDTVGGVAFSSKDGTIRFDNTFEARLERLKPHLRREVARVLGSGASE
ncbi:MAG: hypothetical protein HYW93_08050 [Thaumarchaeota archaeon]|nr:hypothetical protein [Nitrososphaerota archaeon]